MLPRTNDFSRCQAPTRWEFCRSQILHLFTFPTTDQLRACDSVTCLLPQQSPDSFDTTVTSPTTDQHNTSQYPTICKFPDTDDILLATASESRAKARGLPPTLSSTDDNDGTIILDLFHTTSNFPDRQSPTRWVCMPFSATLCSSTFH